MRLFSHAFDEKWGKTVEKCQTVFYVFLYFTKSGLNRFFQCTAEWQKIRKLIDSRNKTQITETEFVTSDLYFTVIICYFIRVLVTPLKKFNKIIA